MGEATNILRTSIHSFFHGYPSFVSVASLLVLPFSASLLLSQSLTTSSSPPSSLHFISNRIRSIFDASSLPLSSPPFSLLTPMLSQTLFSSLLTLPFDLTFLLLAQASVALIARSLPLHHHHHHSPPPLPSLLHLYPSLLHTHLLNTFLFLSANASAFILLFFASASSDYFNIHFNYTVIFSLAASLLYSVIIANTLVTCKLAIVVSAMERCGGYLPIIKACVLIRGRVATALGIALPTNLVMFAVEALFQYRVVRVYRSSGELRSSIVWEAFTIAYMHSFVVVVEMIAGCLFYKRCRESCGGSFEGVFSFEQVEFEPEEKGEV